MAGNSGAGKVAAGVAVGGGVVALVSLAAHRPAAAAPLDEKFEYLTECLLVVSQALGEVAEKDAQLIQLFEQWLATQGVTPDIEVAVSTQWIAKPPEEIFNQTIRTVGVFFSDYMVDHANSKRITIKVESSLDQACNVQVIGNITNTQNRATDVGPVLPCPVNSNVSIGLAWDDWHPRIGVRITTLIAPTVGILTVTAVLQK